MSFIFPSPCVGSTCPYIPVAALWAPHQPLTPGTLAMKRGRGDGSASAVRQPDASAPSPLHHRRSSRRPSLSLSAGPRTFQPLSAMPKRTRSSQAAVGTSTPRATLLAAAPRGAGVLPLRSCARCALRTANNSKKSPQDMSSSA